MIQPIRNNVLVKVFKESEKTEGGLFVPEAYRGDTDKVEVVAVGNGTKNKPMKRKVGEIGYRVHKWGMPICENGETYHLMEDTAIISLQ